MTKRKEEHETRLYYLALKVRKSGTRRPTYGTIAPYSNDRNRENIYKTLKGILAIDEEIGDKLTHKEALETIKRASLENRSLGDLLTTRNEATQQ